MTLLHHDLVQTTRIHPQPLTTPRRITMRIHMNRRRRRRTITKHRSPTTIAIPRRRTRNQSRLQQRHRRSTTRKRRKPRHIHGRRRSYRRKLTTTHRRRRRQTIIITTRKTTKTMKVIPLLLTIQMILNILAQILKTRSTTLPFSQIRRECRCPTSTKPNGIIFIHSRRRRVPFRLLITHHYYRSFTKQQYIQQRETTPSKKQFARSRITRLDQ
mmetsp:Transcript_18905/g.30901  ORF Transcript_18905/g.30901 Transcript_18905/m.30901 type:complete len:214 (+) Transcript_18905:1322-1963(+)